MKLKESSSVGDIWKSHQAFKSEDDSSSEHNPKSHKEKITKGKKRLERLFTVKLQMN